MPAPVGRIERVIAKLREQAWRFDEPTGELRLGWHRDGETYTWSYVERVAAGSAANTTA